MTIEEAKRLIKKKIAGQGNQVDMGSVLPALLLFLIDADDAKQNKLTPGANIKIEDDVISATSLSEAPDDGIAYVRQSKDWKPSNAVKFTAQELSDAEKGRARENIGAPGKVVVDTKEQGQASYAVDANRITKLGVLASAVEITLNAGESGNAAIYDIIFSTGQTVPTITWPVGIVWAGGSAPEIVASKTYEVSISENLAIINEF